MLRGYDKLDSILCCCPVIPALTLDRPEDAVNVGIALADSGLTVVEVLLRTPGAVECISALKSVGDLVIGAGTVLNLEQFAMMLDAGVDFVVTPGSTEALTEVAIDCSVPLLPGASTVSEIMGLVESGYRRVKFFPAEYAGGTGFLKSMQGVFPEVKFYPTGGISSDNAGSYLALDNVACVGGSWIVPAFAVRERNWSLIKDLALAANGLR